MAFIVYRLISSTKPKERKKKTNKVFVDENAFDAVLIVMEIWLISNFAKFGDSPKSFCFNFQTIVRFECPFRYR